MVPPLCNLWFPRALPKLSWTMNTNYFSLQNYSAGNSHLCVLSPSCHSDCSLWQTWIQKPALDINLTTDGSDRLDPHSSSTKLEHAAAVRAELLQWLPYSVTAPLSSGYCHHCCMGWWRSVPPYPVVMRNSQEVPLSSKHQMPAQQQTTENCLWTKPYLLPWLPHVDKGW